LVLAVLAASAVGCSTEVSRLQGANQQLVKERDELYAQIADLKALLDQNQARITQLEDDLKKAQIDIDYWKGQAGAYGDTLEKRRQLGEMGFPEKFMKELADKLNAVYLPGGGIRLSSDVLFDSGKADLKSAARDSLKQVSEAFTSQQAAGLCLRIDGHTDSQPIKYSKWKDNMELSQARARAVWVELKTGGLPPDRMYTAGFGEYSAIDTNATAAGRANNRRVELWLVPKPGAIVAVQAGSSVEPSKESVVPAAELPEPTK